MTSTFAAIRPENRDLLTRIARNLRELKRQLRIAALAIARPYRVGEVL